jgi:signal transduction histidine kinase
LLTRYALDDAKREQILRLIYEESQRLGKLVERFLSVERLSAGEMELRRRPVHLSSLLSATAERLRPAAERKGIQLLREDDRADVEIEGDPELLEFAISNLLTNAVKYSPRGTSVKVALERDGARARIHVADSGPGLSPEEVRRVFDRFYRTKDAARSETPGMGLGLAIAREIARHHGGDLVLESKPGVGSRFTISLPAPAAAPLSEPRPRGSGQ